MVGNAAERLQTDHVAHTLTGQRGHFAGQEPAFAELGREAYHLAGVAGQSVHIAKGLVVAVDGAGTVDLVDAVAHQPVERAADNAGQTLALHPGVALHVLVDETLQEKVEQHGSHHFKTAIDEPLRQAALGIGIEFEEYFTNDAHSRAVTVETDAVEVGGRSRQIGQELTALVALDGRTGHVQIFVAQTGRLTGLTLAGRGGEIHFGDSVTVKDSTERYRRDATEIEVETRLLVTHIVGHAQRHDGHLGIAGLDERFLDKRNIVAGTALASGLGDERRSGVGIVAPAAEGFHDVAHDKGGRVAHLIVGILQAEVARLDIAQRQHFGIVAGHFHERRDEGRDERREIRNDYLAVTLAFGENRRSDKRPERRLRPESSVGGMVGSAFPLVQSDAVNNGTHAEFQ